MNKVHKCPEKKLYNHFGFCINQKKFKEETEICFDFTFRTNQFISLKNYSKPMSPPHISSFPPITSKKKVNISIKPEPLKSLITPSPFILNVNKVNNKRLIINEISLNNYSSQISEENENKLMENVDNSKTSNNNDDSYYIDENNFIVMREGKKQMTILDILEKNIKETTLSNKSKIISINTFNL